MKLYSEQVGLIWIISVLIGVVISVVCIPLSFSSKCAPCVYRISRGLLWGTIPILVLFAASFDPSDEDMKIFWWPGFLASCLPTVLSLIAFLISREKKLSAIIPNSRGKTVVLLSSTLTICIGFILCLFWQNFWLKKSLDHMADQAGAMQAMSEFRKGRLVIWEIIPTNDFPRFSGRYDGPFEVWLDEYHPDMPSAWKYAQRRLDEAHNAQMRLMYQHPERFKLDGRETPRPQTDSSGVPVNQGERQLPK
jgi:hypothetical protein